MKILIAADGSPYTVKAVEYLISHFPAFKDTPELHVLHVKSPVPTEGRAASVLGHDAIENYYKVESEEALAPAEELLKKNGIPFKSGYKVGDVAQEIHAYVKDQHIDMIVMGTHGHGALKNLVMGSVATKVLATSDVPVLLIR